MEIVDRILFWSCAAVVLATVVLLVTCRVEPVWWRLNRRRASRLQNRCLNAMLWIYFSGSGECHRCPVPKKGWQKRIALDTLADLRRTTCGLDAEPLRRMIESRGCLKFLLHCIRRSRGYRRAYYLQLLSYLPVSEETIRAVGCYTKSRNRYVRFYALCVQLSLDPAAALGAVAGFPHYLSYFEQKELLLRLLYEKRPIDFEPMLTSRSRSLQALGLAVVWHFGIREARDELVRLAESDGGELSLGALYALASMNLPVEGKEAAGLLQNLKEWQRHSLFRYMARQGYSAGALKEFIADGDNSYYTSLVDSYKLNVTV